MKHLKSGCRKQVREALEAYRKVVEEAPLTRSTKHTYFLHAEHFVRWLHDDFEPGIQKRK